MAALLIVGALLAAQARVVASPDGRLGLSMATEGKRVVARLWGYDEAGEEITLWTRRLPGLPGESLVSGIGNVALLDVPYPGGEHAVMMIAPDGRTLGDYSLKDLLSPVEIAKLPTYPATATYPETRLWRKEREGATLAAPAGWHIGMAEKKVKGVRLFGSSAEALSVPTTLGTTLAFNAYTGARWPFEGKFLSSTPPG